MRNRFFLALDVVAGVAIVFLAFCVRFEGLAWWPALARTVVFYTAIVIPCRIGLFLAVGVYNRLWRYASVADLEVAMLACLLGSGVSFIVGLVAIPALHLGNGRIPIGVVLMDAALMSAAFTTSRLVLRVRAWRHHGSTGKWSEGPNGSRSSDGRRVLIAGAGHAGGMIVKELLENRQVGLIPIGFLDDDIQKHGHRLHGLPVLGSISDLESIVERFGVDEVITALPSARGKVIRDIMQRSLAVGARNRTVPGLYEILSGAKSVSALRPIQIEDLLRREPVKTNADEVSGLVTGKTVMITGAGGSIGSELCRQLCQLGPERLVLVGRGENSIFELMQELRRTWPGIPLRPAIADVRDAVRMRAIFDDTRPYSVFHAAAHKHVPLMEANVDEAILNNVLGTRTVVRLCEEFDVQHMVLISTDKAVRPTSIMGATKRIAECTLCTVAARTHKSFVSVRFGNVLGSRGSVVPTFLRQIAAGGPITITDPEMRRYFMTIPEAVQLVLQAAALGRGGEVFVLNMGDPVKITDLAEDLIRLSGLEAGHDIEVSYTGIRPGEKLYEELFFGPADATPTGHPKILKARDTAVSAVLDEQIEALIDAARRRVAEAELRQMIQGLVPEYTPPGSTPASVPTISQQTRTHSVSQPRMAAALAKSTLR